jgi:hypothetical protein
LGGSDILMYLCDVGSGHILTNAAAGIVVAFVDWSSPDPNLFNKRCRDIFKFSSYEWSFLGKNY